MIHFHTGATEEETSKVADETPVQKEEAVEETAADPAAEVADEEEPEEDFTTEEDPADEEEEPKQDEREENTELDSEDPGDFPVSFPNNEYGVIPARLAPSLFRQSKKIGKGKIRNGESESLFTVSGRLITDDEIDLGQV